MKNYMVRYRRGLTLVELATTMAIIPIVVLSVGLVLVGSQKGWNKTYNHVNDGSATDGYAATKAFESVVRKASKSSELLSDGQLYVYYYNDTDTSTYLDRYAKFYSEEENLIVDYGTLDSEGNPQTVTSTLPLAYNLKSVDFYDLGDCIQMVLELEDDSGTLTVMTSAIRHNE